MIQILHLHTPPNRAASSHSRTLDKPLENAPEQASERSFENSVIREEQLADLLQKEPREHSDETSHYHPQSSV